MKTRIYQDQADVVVVEDHPYDGSRIKTAYFCPLNGGYVRIRDREGRYPQVCDRLASTGSTLTSPSAAALLSVIRREYRAYRAAERREASRE